MQDFTWWSGLTVADARKGIELAGPRLEREDLDGSTCWSAAEAPAASPEPSPAHLLPQYDEYTVAYRDRSAVLDPAQTGVISSNGIFYPILVLDGQVAGTWKRVVKKGEVIIALSPFALLKKKDRKAIATAAGRYGAFLGMPVVVE